MDKKLRRNIHGDREITDKTRDNEGESDKHDKSRLTERKEESTVLMFDF